MTDPKDQTPKDPTPKDPTPKDSTPGRAKSSSKPAHQSTTDAPAPDSLQQLLEQLGRIADSVTRLTEPKSAAADAGQAAESGPAAQERAKALFAYEFLGEVLGRPGFAVPRVQVSRGTTVGRGRFITTLIFQQLNGGTTARVRAADNRQQILLNLQVGNPVDVEEIPVEQPIDSIVVLDGSGVPVAIGPCLEALVPIPLNNE